MSVKTAQTNTSATLYTGRGRALGVYFVGAATAGTVILRDGGSGGTILATINTAPITTSGTTSSGFVPFAPERGGLAFATDLYCALSTAAFATVVYEPM